MKYFEGLGNVFTFADLRRMGKVLFIIENLGKSDDWWKMTFDQFVSADRDSKISMCNTMLDIYNCARKCDFMTLEDAVILSAYPA